MSDLNQAIKANIELALLVQNQQARISELEQQLAEAERNEGNLAMMMRMLINKINGASNTARKAQKLLEEYGQEGSPLRSAPPKEGGQ